MGTSTAMRAKIAGWYATPAVVVLVVLLLANLIADSSFFAPDSWPATFASIAPYMLVAMAVTPAIMSGGAGVDLSVGPLAGFVAAVVVAKLVPNGLGALWLAAPIAILIGAAVGLGNAVMTCYLRVPPIVATLGTYLVLSGGAIKVLPDPGGKAPGWLSALSGGIGPIPKIWLLIALVAVPWTLLQRSAYGRNLLAVGGDDRAAFTAGVSVERVRLVAYVSAGMIAAVAGLAFVSNLDSADPNVGPPYTLIALAAAPLGGVSLMGGRGGLLGAGIGGIVLFLVQHLLDSLGVSVFVTQMAYGVVLVLALAANSLSDRRRRSRGVRAEPALAAGLDQAASAA